jgi:hypothetical protein
MALRLALLLVGLMSVVPVAATADFYRYYDENGGVNVTNDYKSIPERYRASVTVTTDKQLEKKALARERQERSESGRPAQAQRQSRVPQQATSAQSAPTEAAPPASTVQKEPAHSATAGKSGWLSRQLPMLKVMGVIGLLVAGFVVIGRVVSSLAPRSLAIVIKIAMIAAIGVFLTKGFSEKIADAFARIKDESAVAQKAVDKRSEKIQQQAE